ncbi:MAG: DUF2190 family protein [SAR116 cluster bacterium]|nr:hypothetical protein [Paracoccaceae bacterium]RCL81434.1 MAG: DUF2190 family protein [SAR116 cluster bacterium]RPH14167.1 MAG: DUF2190 family protein [Alphaproteobacteria bacterium TMED150]HBQ22517.1 hypothetical protein [Alphaproteobacteria bacterium]HCJ61961.1 hypothetical protein [Alphaproteobacteria bacterium]
MRNHIQPGNTISLVAPFGVISGAGLLVSALFGIAGGHRCLAKGI